jgi:hypothetical protein
VLLFDGGRVEAAKAEEGNHFKGISLERRKAAFGQKQMCKNVPGVAINVSLTPVEGKEEYTCTVDCRGEILSETVVPKAE